MALVELIVTLVKNNDTKKAIAIVSKIPLVKRGVYRGVTTRAGVVKYIESKKLDVGIPGLTEYFQRWFTNHLDDDSNAPNATLANDLRNAVNNNTGKKLYVNSLLEGAIASINALEQNPLELVGIMEAFLLP